MTSSEEGALGFAKPCDWIRSHVRVESRRNEDANEALSSKGSDETQQPIHHEIHTGKTLVVLVMINFNGDNRFDGARRYKRQQNYKVSRLLALIFRWSHQIGVLGWTAAY